MHFDINSHTIYKCYHGSRAYGTNVAGSDVDIKGIAVAPHSHVCGFAYPFEQHESTKPDIVIYDLRKFMKLAADCNPNIIEVLFCSEADILDITDCGRELRKNSQLFLSRKAKHTFSGYAFAQLKRIKSHKAWLLDPPDHKPTREKFGLPEKKLLSASEIGATEKLIVTGVPVTENVLRALELEKAYGNALTKWHQYETWKAERNTKRAELEAKFGYDTKHAYHLVRLMRMCGEILRGEGVIVRRPDAKELLEIRNGSWSYDKLIEWAEDKDAENEALMANSPLPHSPDLLRLNALCADLHELAWFSRDLAERKAVSG